jgi:hypothetical protein
VKPLVKTPVLPERKEGRKKGRKEGGREGGRKPMLHTVLISSLQMRKLRLKEAT